MNLMKIWNAHDSMKQLSGQVHDQLCMDVDYHFKDFVLTDV